MAVVAFGLSLAILLPIMVYARSQSEKVLREPQVVESRNSQMMALLTAPRNYDPIASVGGAEVAIIDNTALTPSSTAGEAFVESGKSGSGEISIYVVKSGDTLSEIAEAHGVSQNTILWANDIKSAKTIKVGQELVILPVSGVRHVVKSGDTLSTIATKYKADMSDILSYNSLPDDAKIKPGDLIVIPGGQISASSALASRPASTVSSSKLTTAVSTGYFARPINGGKRSQGIHGNNGVDIAAPVGTSIMAAASGRVVVSRTGGFNGGYGTYVVISHDNGTQTLYAHMAANNVSVGESVSQGQVIGSIGMTGRTTGPHIHFEVRGAKNPF
jgi:murein DD-endopeptidase MepM/ murein hydrolase activator NlpD